MTKTAAGPTIRAQDFQPDLGAILESYNLTQLKPKVSHFSDEVRVMVTKNPIPDPKTINMNLPEILDFQWTIPGVEPTLAFTDFIAGVACVTMIVPEEYQPAIKQALTEGASRVLDTGALPTLDADFLRSIETGVSQIMANGEPISWRGFLAFLQGAYWLLGFIERPYDKRSKGGLSPLEFVELLISHNAPFGFIPKG